MIVNRPKARTVKFRELPVGAGFRWENWYYIKIEKCQVLYKDIGCPVTRTIYEAVQLETGLLASFNQSDLVEKIPMSIEVLE